MSKCKANLANKQKKKKNYKNIHKNKSKKKVYNNFDLLKK